MGVFRGSVFRVQERKAVLDAYHLTAEQYSRNQLACDLRNRMLRLLNTGRRAGALTPRAEPLNTQNAY